MFFNSLNYLLFFPIVLFVSFCVPKRFQYIWLLMSSYFFYMCWNPIYVFLLIGITGITYIGAICIDKIKEGPRKAVLCGTIICCLGILCYFKYWDFLCNNILRILHLIGMKYTYDQTDIILPIGISFFTFQAVGYLIDIYRREISPEKNVLRYALFVSFFPQLVAGPIERAKNLMDQLKNPCDFKLSFAQNGLPKIFWGLFLKMVVADNIALVIDPILADWQSYSGMELFVTVMLFAIQIYCDFNGYTQIAIGSAEILGIRLIENFKTPYFSLSVKEFWTRWHLSLTNWFRDYVYISLGGNRKGLLRKQLNTLVVFLLSGIWHGAAWHYVVWGGLNGLLSVAEDLTKGLRARVKRILKIQDNLMAYKLLCCMLTFFAVDFTWIFFRMGISESVQIIIRILKDFRFEWFLVAGYAKIFTSPENMMVIMLSLVTLFVVDYVTYKGKNVISAINGQQKLIRWVIYALMVLVILYCGAYGGDYEQKEFIYFQF